MEYNIPTEQNAGENYAMNRCIESYKNHETCRSYLQDLVAIFV